jgi:hypothetical protein
LDQLYVSRSGYLFIQLTKKDEPDQYGNYFSISEDSWAANNAREKDGDALDDVDTSEDELL